MDGRSTHGRGDQPIREGGENTLHRGLEGCSALRSAPGGTPMMRYRFVGVRSPLALGVAVACVAACSASSPPTARRPLAPLPAGVQAISFLGDTLRTLSVR